jgi:hypothetical protein
MIANWKVAHDIRRKWLHGDILVTQVLSVLDLALSQHEIALMLGNPDFYITVAQPPAEFCVVAGGYPMLSYSIAELNLRANVHLYSL